MYKKSRLARSKQRVSAKKQLGRRKLARQLISGALNLAQVEDRDPEGLSRVLRAVAYLSESEGVQIPSALGPAVSHALAPATFGISIPQVTRSAKMNPRRRGSTESSEGSGNLGSTELLPQEIAATSPPRRRRTVALKSGDSGLVETGVTVSGTAVSGKTTSPRRAKKSSPVENIDSAEEKAPSSNRRRTSSSQITSALVDSDTPVKPPRAKRQRSTPKVDDEN
jgi:hypothetical protein